MLEHAVREELNRTSPRVMGVLNPLKVVIENYPEGQVDELEAVNNPQAETSDTRKVPFSRELYIERDDFREEANRKYHRLKPGQEPSRSRKRPRRRGPTLSCSSCPTTTSRRRTGCTPTSRR